MRSREEVPSAVTARIVWVRRGFVALLAALGAVVFDMQVLRTEEFRNAAELNSMRRVRIRAPRGLILDRSGRVLVKNRPSFDAVVLADRMTDPETTLARARRVLALEEAAVSRLRRRVRAKGATEVLVKEDLTLAEVAALEARSYEWPEFRIREGLVRSYPYGSAAAHVFGHVGEVREDQLQDPAYRDYAQGDVVGQSGIEARYERFLRGEDGFRRVLVNSRGREIRALDGIEPPRPGLEVHLTLDLDVQQAGEAAFGEQRGAAVAIDNRTGAVLALMSRPAFDPNAFAGKLNGPDWKRYNMDPAHPLFDRALLGKLPPGSVFKVVDAIAGLEDRVWDPDADISCAGHTTLYGDVRRCWKREGHGVVSLHEALRGSCNVYFYHRGDALGIERIARWSRLLGLGEKTGIDLDPESRGVVPDPTWKRRVRGEPWWPGETVSVAIGQGALGVSVLQVSSMMQVVANEGPAYVPYLVDHIGEGAYRRAPQKGRDVPLRPETRVRLKRGLWAVVNEPRGTGGRARIEGFDVSGKTGTAQAPGPGTTPEETKDHAWFAGYAPGEKPQMLAVVFVEHVGHGGEFAAPIARALLVTGLEKQGLKPPDGGPRESPAPGVALFIGPPRPAVVLTSAGSARRAEIFIGPPRPPGLGTFLTAGALGPSRAPELPSGVAASSGRPDSGARAIAPAEAASPAPVRRRRAPPRAASRPPSRASAASEVRPALTAEAPIAR